MAKPTPPKSDSALISITDAARELQVSKISVRRMIRAKRLTAFRFSQNLVRLKRSDIAKLIEEASA